MTETCDILVVGAGLAGLQCARLLAEAGRDVEVWDASDDVGGRIRTDEVDGYLVDRGFQVLNPGYPAVRRWADVEALGLQVFGAGVGVRRTDGLAVLADPLREPRRLLRTLASGMMTPAGVLALARWAAPALGRPERRDHARDVSIATALDRVSLGGELCRVVERFLAGVLLEDEGATANDFALLLLRSFVLGVPGVPERGMQALPRQLAAMLSTAPSLGRRVTAVEAAGAVTRVHADGGDPILARRVVVATDAWALADVAGLDGVHPPESKGVLTHWWATDEPPTDLPMVCVDARPRPPGPLVNTTVMTLAAPSYAPPGRHLVETSALLGPGRPVPTDQEVRRHAGDVFGCDPGGWDLVARHEVPRALAAAPPPLDPRRSLAAGTGLPGVWVCGDHRDTGSIQGALVSGSRAAHGVLRSLR